MMRSVILYGELGKRFGRHHRFAVKTAAEAIRALRANFKGFEQFMCSAHERSLGFKVLVGGHPINDCSEVHNPSGSREVIKIVPLVFGSGGEVKILLGGLLIAAAVVLAPFTAGGSLAFVPTALGALGAGLLIGGVASLLAPSPPTARERSTPDEAASYLFNGAENTSTQGRAVPVCYGRMIVGSVVISAGIETEDV